MNSKGRIYKISVSSKKGEKKTNIDSAILEEGHGIVGDAHAGTARQVSLLPFESFDKVKNDIIDIQPGDFAENITTSGLEFQRCEIGQRLGIGNEIILEITQIGKECHHACSIKEAVGECIMPREGIFAKVIKGGKMQTGDRVYWSE